MQREPQPPTAPTVGTDTGELPVVRIDTLDRWLKHAWEDGVQIDQLEDLHALRVETLNNTYDLAIVSSRVGEVLVRGGRYFPDWTTAQYLGCSLGGGLLKLRGVYVGFRMELYWAGRLVITSPIQAISQAPEARSDRPAFEPSSSSRP